MLRLRWSPCASPLPPAARAARASRVCAHAAPAVRLSHRSIPPGAAPCCTPRHGTSGSRGRTGRPRLEQRGGAAAIDRHGTSPGHRQPLMAAAAQHQAAPQPAAMPTATAHAQPAPGGAPSSPGGGLSERRLGLLFVVPALVLMASSRAYPVLNAIWLSLHRYNVKVPERLRVRRARQLHAHPERAALVGGDAARRSSFAVVSVTVEFFLGLAMALVMNQALGSVTGVGARRRARAVGDDHDRHRARVEVDLHARRSRFELDRDRSWACSPRRAACSAASGRA